MTFGFFRDVPDGTGIVMNGLAVPEGATITLDDNPIVTLRLIKELDH